jgi:predicted small lipoprotein YifL
MKKTLSRVLAAAVVLLALAGCGDMQATQSKCAFPQGTGGPCV